MENIVTKCIRSNNCHSVCNIKGCKNIPFMCHDDECDCYLQHKNCKTNIRWKKIKQMFDTKLKNPPATLIKYFKQIEELYKDVLKQIQRSFSQLQKITYMIGLTKIERDVLLKLKENKFNEMSGEMINQLDAQFVIKDDKTFQIRRIKKQKDQIQKQTLKLIKMFQELTEPKPIAEMSEKKIEVKVEQNKVVVKPTEIKQSEIKIVLSSKITQDVDTILSFFPNKKIKNINLLYRASQNNFQVTKFHTKCDNIAHTIIIVKTQFGKIIGGYTSLLWKKTKDYQYGKDDTKQTFIFSLNQKHKLPIINGQEARAIYNYCNWGPAFGYAGDLIIKDRANQNIDSHARVGNSFNNGQYIWNNQQSIKKFSGQQSGDGFKIVEWEVHQIIFS